MIGVDFMGPLPLSKARNSVLMVVVDYYIKWVELFALKDAKGGGGGGSVKVTKVHFMDREYVREVSNAVLFTCMFVILCIFTNVRCFKV